MAVLNFQLYDVERIWSLCYLALLSYSQADTNTGNDDRAESSIPVKIISRFGRSKGCQKKNNLFVSFQSEFRKKNKN